ncbi:MAG: NYN domain-containing protein [Betaproteobacteria bacterium]|nr:NYN domain-containing protein [Betaproteobacteria bacterium]
MAGQPEITNMALFCDFENVALGVRDAKYAQFDIGKVLERLLLKGSIVVKKAYCDWDRYKEFKATMHEAAFELIEIPHVRQSGKNSADIRMVVDALDLCYTKEHVDTFVIISGDSDFSPLVSKLRENNKRVIGIGVKDSTSNLLSANCDEFIFYDDLVREQEAKRQRAVKKTPAKPAAAATAASPAKKAKPEDDKHQEALDFLVETIEALIAERGSDEKIWGSMVKPTMQRRRPGFTESSYGYRSFKELLEDAQRRNLLTLAREEKSGQYLIHLPLATDT